MGVYPAMRSALTGKQYADRFLRWAYRAPFAAAIVSQDGSGVESWLRDALANTVPCHTLINGVDLEEEAASADDRLRELPQGQTVVLFLGKLEVEKGCDEFLEAFMRAREAVPGELHALIVGTGPRLEPLRQQVGDAQAADSVTFIDRLPHDQIKFAHERSDIYVSLNRLGNLSNANLEAMKFGQCMVFPKGQIASGIDVATDKIIPENAAARVPSATDVDALVRVILDLHRAPETRRALAYAMRDASEFIPTWSERISVELEIIRRLGKSSAGEPGVPQA